jgi:hypothetical protein
LSLHCGKRVRAKRPTPTKIALDAQSVEDAAAHFTRLWLHFRFDYLDDASGIDGAWSSHCQAEPQSASRRTACTYSCSNQATHVFGPDRIKMVGANGWTIGRHGCRELGG